MDRGRSWTQFFILISIAWIQTFTTGTPIAQRSSSSSSSSATVSVPKFELLKKFYPGYRHQGGKYSHQQLIRQIGCNKSCQKSLLHDTSAVRLSHTLNQIGDIHSLGKTLIRLSKYGQDSVSGSNHMQYIYHPIAYGPFLADKYGYPTVSKMHATEPIHTMKKFFGKQGILQIITYAKVDNKPIGHVALWDCTHFHQSKNWIAGHEFITVEFWESPDSKCPKIDNAKLESFYSGNDPSDIGEETAKNLRHKAHNKHKGSRRYQHLLKLVKMKNKSKHLQPKSLR